MAASDGTSTTGTDDLLPVYSPLSPTASASAASSYYPADSASSSSAGQDAFVPGRGQPFVPESLSSLNPEVAKKLAAEAREAGRPVADYGFLSAEDATTVDDLEFRDVPAVSPPSFAEGEVRPTYEIDGQGNIVSHDVNLNSSPAALLRFLRLHCSSPPSLTIHLRGTHTEKRTETRIETHNGRRRARTETRDVEVEDFQFTINASSLVEEGLGSARGVGGVRGVLYEVGGWEAVHRGGSWKVRERREEERIGEGVIRLPAEEGEGGEEEGRMERIRRAWRYVHPSYRERRKLDKERRERSSRGFPGFVHPDCLVDMEEDHRSPEGKAEHPAVLYHSHFVDLVETHAAIPFALTRTNAAPLPQAFDALLLAREKRDDDVRKVVEAYCASDRQLKELRIQKELYGWNFRLLEAGLRATIDTSAYRGTVQVQIKTTPDTIIIRPENFVARIFSAPMLVKLLLWVFLIYPVLLLIELFIGDRYENLRVAYPLTRWRRLPIPASTSSSSSSASSSTLKPSDAQSLARSLTSRAVPRINQLPADKSWLYLVGTQEGEWLRSWESGIARAVREGKRGVVLTEADKNAGLPTDARLSLRGYSG